MLPHERDTKQRMIGLDVLKCFCAFFVVVIHAPFHGRLGAYFTSLMRIAVPVFFMITGFFYQDVVARRAEKRQILKTLQLIIVSNVLFLVWNLFADWIGDGNIQSSVMAFLKPGVWLRLLLLNESPVSGHLWYLNALLYVLLIVFFAKGKLLMKVLCWATPVLLLCDLVFGKYSLVLINREIPYAYVRNFLFVGVPYFCVGFMISQRKAWIERTFAKRQWLLLVLVMVFALTTFLERYVLEANAINAARDHYLSTTFLAISAFAFCMAIRRRCINARGGTCIFALIGKRYSAVIYVIHPILIKVLSIVAIKLSLSELYVYVQPIAVFACAAACAAVLDRINNQLTKLFQRKI